MSAIDEVLIQDLEAIMEAYDSDDFSLMNIFSNRILSTAVILGNESVFVPGFFFKNVALTFQRLKYQKSDTISTAKSVCKPILNDMKELCFSSEKSSGIYWAKYLEYMVRIRRFVLKEIEERVYKDNLDYTEKSFNWLINYLDENRELLKKENNLLFSGIQNEMDRIIRCHSGKLKDIIFLTLIRALDNMYIYMLYVGGEELDKIDYYLNKYLHEYKEEELSFENTHILLKEILEEWRKYYIKYMDIAIQRRHIQRGFKIPVEVEEKLTESIAKTLEEEIEESVEKD